MRRGEENISFKCNDRSRKIGNLFWHWACDLDSVGCASHWMLNFYHRKEREREKRRCELIPARFLLIDGYQRISRNKIEGFLIASDYSYSSTPCRLNGNCQLRSVSAVQRGTEVRGWHKLTGSAAVARNQFHIVELSFQSSINRAWRIIVSLHQLFFYAARLPTERKRFFLICSFLRLLGILGCLSQLLNSNASSLSLLAKLIR